MKRSRQNGFSLVEILIGLMLTALLMQSLPPLLFTTFLSWQHSVARTVTHQTARMAMEAMTRELRLASAVVRPAAGQNSAAVEVKITNEAGQVSRLIFQLGTTLGANQRTLYRISSAGQPTPLTENTVSQFQIAFQPPRLLTINLTLTDPQTGVADSITSAVTCTNAPD